MSGQEFKIGQTVSWVAGGKVSRLDGVKGKRVTGIITEIDLPAGEITVRKNYSSLVGTGLLSITENKVQIVK